MKKQKEENLVKNNRINSNIECSVCIFVTTAKEDLIKGNKTEDEIKDLVEKICNIFSGSLQAQVWFLNLIVVKFITYLVNFSVFRLLPNTLFMLLNYWSLI